MQRPPQKIYGFGLLFPVKVSHLIHTMLLSMYMEMVNSQTVGEIALAMYAPPFVYPLRGGTDWKQSEESRRKTLGVSFRSQLK